MTENEVLAILEIEDFRHLSKDKVIRFASLFTEMEPAVAQKALEQFPDFARSIVELASSYKDTLVNCVTSNSLATQSCLTACQTIIDTLSNRLKDGVESYEERRYYIDAMRELSSQMQNINSENKNFMWKVIVITGITTMVLGGIMLKVLGGSVKSCPFPQVAA